MKTKEKGLSGDLFTADEIVNEAERIRRIERAAPELLEACKQMLDYLKTIKDANREDALVYASVSLCPAIAKAEGRAQ